MNIKKLKLKKKSRYELKKKTKHFYRYYTNEKKNQIETPNDKILDFITFNVLFGLVLFS